MKKLLVYFLLGAFIVPVFHYNDCVKIKDEFYGVLYGIVVQKPSDGLYTVLITSHPELVSLTLSTPHIRKVENSYCKEPK